MGLTLFGVGCLSKTWLCSFPDFCYYDRYAFGNPVTSLASDAFAGLIFQDFAFAWNRAYIHNVLWYFMQMRGVHVQFFLFRSICLCFAPDYDLMFTSVVSQCQEQCGINSICTTQGGVFWDSSEALLTCSCQQGFLASGPGPVSPSTPWICL